MNAVLPLLSSTPGWFEVSNVAGDRIEGFARLPDTIWSETPIAITIEQAALLPRARESVPGTRLPRRCYERHVLADSTFCLGLGPTSVTDETSRRLWWSDLGSFLECQSTASETGLWPLGAALDHAGAGFEHARALACAEELGVLEDYLAVHCGAQSGFPTSVLAEHGRKRTFRKLLAADRRRRALLEEWTAAARRSSIACCGTMRDCPLPRRDVATAMGAMMAGRPTSLRESLLGHAAGTILRGRYQKRKTMGDLLDRFAGDGNRELLLGTLRRQALIAGDMRLAKAFADHGVLAEYGRGERLIEQGAWDTDLFFILAGSFDVFINKQYKANRGPGVHVGELTGLNGARARTATLIAASESLVLKVRQQDVETVAGANPDFWRAMADVVADRLDQRNAEVGEVNACPRVLIISSTEAKEVGRRVRAELNGEAMHVHMWDKGVFTLSGYPISDLEDAIDAADFTISIVRPDDTVIIREERSTATRDNVHLEFGISVGKLGRRRSILLVDAAPGLHLPTDASGLTYLRYQHRDKDEMERTVAVACDMFREHAESRGVRRNRSRGSD